MKISRRINANRRVKLATIMSVTIVLVAIAALGIILLYASTGETADRLKTEELEESALQGVKETIPEADKAERMNTEMYDAQEKVLYNLQDASGKDLGIAVVDSITGKVTYLYDARVEWASEKINISLEDARSIAEGFLTKRGVDLSRMSAEQCELNRVGVGGPPNQTIDLFRYEFSYRDNIDGIPVDGGNSCFVWVNPEDGRIISFDIIQYNKPVFDKDKGSVSISMEEASIIAINTHLGKIDLEKEKKNYGTSELKVSVDTEKNERGEEVAGLDWTGFRDS